MKQNKSIACYICQKEGKYLFSVKKSELYKCLDCDLVWIRDFKQPDYSNYHNDTTYLDCKSLFDNIFSRIVGIANSIKPNKGKVFEIGASVGGLLMSFKADGWKTSGVEPSDKAQKEANKNGIEVYLGSFEKIKLKESSYDLVVINHTLEHVDEPFKVLEKIKQILKPGGLLMIGVPNFASLKSQFLKQNWNHILPKEHKWQYSPKSLKFLIEAAGYRTVSIYTASGIFEHQNPVKEVVNSLLGFKKRFFISLMNLPIDFIETHTGHGEGMLLVAEKRG